MSEVAVTELSSDGLRGAAAPILKLVAAINERDAARIGEMLCVDHELIDSFEARTRGRERASAAWMRYVGLFPGYHLEVNEIIAIEACFVVFGEARGGFAAADIPRNTSAWRSSIAWRVEVEGALLSRLQMFADNKYAVRNAQAIQSQSTGIG